MAIPGKLTSNHGLPGYLFSRTRMLNGSIHTAYGPGQPPNCLDGSGYNISGAPATFSYLNPTGWMPAGSLLRVPQVIHVSITYPWYSAVSRASSNPVISAHANEYLRIRNQLDVLCSYINSIRPNRTWAARINWLSVASQEEVSNGPDGPDPNAPNFSYGNRYHHMMPLPANSHFFGTNYLNIWIGTISWDLISSGTLYRQIGYTYYYADIFGAYHPIPILNDTITSGAPGYQANCKPCITTNYSNFAKFSTWLYGSNIDWQLGFGLQMPLASNQALFDTATDLAAYGFSYNGDNSSITAVNLLNLIAEYFGFNPVTGQDL